MTRPFLISDPFTDAELHQQACAQAWIWRRPHTLVTPGKMPFTHFANKLPGQIDRPYTAEQINPTVKMCTREDCHTPPCNGYPRPNCLTSISPKRHEK